MASFPHHKVVFTWAMLLLLLSSSSAQLSDENYYSKTCPNLLEIVKNAVHEAIWKEPRMGASLLRLHFHDCFVNGCDGSVLLDDTPTFTGEKTAGPNNNSIRGFEVIDEIKSSVEKQCSGVVSCADILAIAARDSVKILEGPQWKVKLGRRDALTASRTAANQSLPAPSFNLSALINNFQKHNLNVKDLVALSGAHTIGQARCTSFRAHIYNDTNVDPSFAQERQSHCSAATGSSDNNLAPLDLYTPTKFDNHYFVDIVYKKGLLHSDQELYNGHPKTIDLVMSYYMNQDLFKADFAKAIVKMGDIKPLTGSNGEIRKNCRTVNSKVNY